MRRGSWLQFGDRSQVMALEQLELGSAVGVIVSSRDIKLENAINYADKYHDLGAHVLIDHQFYLPSFTNKNLSTYIPDDFRKSITILNNVSEKSLSDLSNYLYNINKGLKSDGIIAPAVVFEADRPDIVELNTKLFAASKSAGDALGVPTYATLVIGHSATSSDSTLDKILSYATSLNPDGWYYAFQFDPERIPSIYTMVYRYCYSGLMLACTGKSVLNAFAGPMGLLSLGFGCTGVAIGHSQNLWHFTSSRWKPSDGTGGGGNAPPRFFSSSLWGTTIYPDETVQFGAAINGRLLSHSEFSEPVKSNTDWSRWDANKHLIRIICSTVNSISSNSDPVANAGYAIDVLDNAIALHSDISKLGILLADNTFSYQANWKQAMQDLLTNHLDEYEYLKMLG